MSFVDVLLAILETLGMTLIGTVLAYVLGFPLGILLNITSKNGIKPKNKSIMADAMSKIGMEMEMMKDNSDARVADMLTKGFTMGNVDISKKIDRFEGDCDKEILNLAKDLLKFGKENIDYLKPYL